MFGSLGATATVTFPQMPGGNPGWCEILVQWAPASVVLYSPLPGPPLDSIQWRRYACHMLAYRTCGFDGAIPRVIAPVLSSTYRIFFQVCPPSVVLNTPRSGLDTHPDPVHPRTRRSDRWGRR